ncbi:MAG: hypothetical protein KatS3mg023_1320 [Armatimonadota bacterium]|nr:MAG: hypothetical protein KatS3mg023_1320 [Armatimonadota bacterium]
MEEQKPVYPFTIIYRDGSQFEMKDEEVVSLWGEFDPYFYSDDLEERQRLGIVKIVDALGRPVRLSVELTDVVVCELAEEGYYDVPAQEETPEQARLRDQHISRHRPWERRKSDRRFWDRF